MRIISVSKTELMLQGPDRSSHNLPPECFALAARLVNASTAYEHGSAHAEEMLRSLVGELPHAVLCCAHAARHELSHGEQQRLLRAAAFGKAYVPGQVEKSLLPATCATLRLLNTLRAPCVGMPLTCNEYDALGLSGVLNRLLATRDHALAWSVADYMHLKDAQADITLHWCCIAMHDAPAAFSDSALLERLIQKLKQGPRVQALKVAEEAYHVGRVQLAMLLLDASNAAPNLKVPLLLSMGALPTALSNALESADREVIHLVLHHAKNCLAEVELFEMALLQPVAQQLLAAYCSAREPQVKAFLFFPAPSPDACTLHCHAFRISHGQQYHFASQNEQLLKTLYYHANRPDQAAVLALREAYAASLWAQRIRGLSIALQFFEHNAGQIQYASPAWSQNSPCGLDLTVVRLHKCRNACYTFAIIYSSSSRATEEQLKLLDVKLRCL